jgi:hypothetical protein
MLLSTKNWRIPRKGNLFHTKRRLGFILFVIMNGQRITLLPDQRLRSFAPTIRERLSDVARCITPANFWSLTDPMMKHVLDSAFRKAQASEGSLWLADAPSNCLVPVYNTGANPDEFLREARQPLNAGLISMVFSAEIPFIENGVSDHTGHDKSIDTLFGAETFAMIAAPFYFLEGCRGVLSCVQLRKVNSAAPPPPGFAPGDQEAISLASVVFGRLLDLCILETTLGLR